MEAMRAMIEKLKLTVNEEKTHLCQIPQKRFDFLGYTFGRCYNQEHGRAYIGTRPSKKSMKRMMESLTEETSRNRTLLETKDLVKRLNRKMVGWANYFCLGQVTPAYRTIGTHLPRQSLPVGMPETSAGGQIQRINPRGQTGSRLFRRDVARKPHHAGLHKPRMQQHHRNPTRR
jgi:hypothetical protein